MLRSSRPRLEALEGKALLSGLAVPPPGLVSSLSAVVERAAGGPKVVATFAETNVSSHPISEEDGPSIDGFAVARGGKVVWTSAEGATPDFVALRVLAPGQSLTLHATWDGRANDVNPSQPWEEGPPLSGTFTVSDALDQGKATATVTLPKAPGAPANLTHIVPPRPPARPH